MKKIALAVSVLGVSAAGASAADMAPQYTKAPLGAPVVAYNWSGCHVGVNGGAVVNDSSMPTRNLNGTGFFPAGLVAALYNPHTFNDTYGTVGGRSAVIGRKAIWSLGLREMRTGRV